MRHPGSVFLSCITLALMLGGCSSQTTDPPIASTRVDCHIIYDAGSKGTRLYIYERSEPGWLRHGGPKVGALADPVRGIRGKTMNDAGAVVDDIVGTLEQLRSDGPSNKKGKAKWPAFDWRQRCNVRSASVYATAGMRLAEQVSTENSQKLMKLLNQRLKKAVGIDVETRTISGFEEGVFAWLSTVQTYTSLDVGVAEMGGASMQVTFACPDCSQSRPVKVWGRKVPVYSHTFMGWGQDEAYKKFGKSDGCRLGAGRLDSQWQVSDCSAGMTEFKLSAVEVSKNIALAGTQRWYLSDAFKYMKDDDIERYCELGDDSGYEPESACYRAVYLHKVIKALGLPADARVSDVDWTLGAVLCRATQCLDSD